MLRILLRKQLEERFSVFKRNKKDLDAVSIIITVLLVIAIVAAVLFVFVRFLKMYCGITIDGVMDVRARQFEVLAVVYLGIFVANVLSGVREINKVVFESNDLAVMTTLPISANTLFLSKLITIYIRQSVNTAITVLPVNLAFFFVTNPSGGYIALTFAICLLLPLVTLAFSAVLSLPLYVVRKKLESKYAMWLVCITIIVGLIYFGYSVLLDKLGDMMASGDIQFFFSEDVMMGIINVTANLFPGNVFAGMLLGINAGQNWGIFVAMTVGGAVIAALVVKVLFDTALVSRAQATTKVKIRVLKSLTRQRKPFHALVNKEFLTVVHTPAYVFSYLSTAVTMPLMVYFCTAIASDMVKALLYIDCNTELVLTVVLLFGVLTNTFCATNISRDGDTFFAMKTLPASYKSVVLAKVVACSIVSAASVLISCIVAAACGYVSAADATFICVVGVLMGEAQICFATRYDFNHPVFSQDSLVNENNRALPVVIACGLLAALVFGGLSVFVALVSGLQGNATASALFTYLFTGLGAAALCGGAVCYLLKGLDRKYLQITEGDR